MNLRLFNTCYCAYDDLFRVLYYFTNLLRINLDRQGEICLFSSANFDGFLWKSYQTLLSKVSFCLEIPIVTKIKIHICHNLTLSVSS